MEMKSIRFRQEREAGWRELEGLVTKAEKGGLRTLDADELMRLPRLYRAALSSLSVARSISLDRSLTAYLESLAARAYLYVYGTRTDIPKALARYFRHLLPATVRGMARPLALAILALGLGWIAGHTLTAHSPDWFYTLVDDGMAGGRTPTASREFLEKSLYGGGPGPGFGLGVFATYLFTHNAAISMMSFALGFALGIPTLLLLFYNGATIGAMTAVFASKGLGGEFFGWLAVHGSTELLAVALCGAAGLSIGGAVAFPGPHPRLATLARTGRRAGVVVMGGVLMLLVAGGLEGFARQLVTDTTTRMLIGGAMLALWTAYFGFVGRGLGPADVD
ncbi:MAG: stage II sporulation protein M [Alphaproteobacteria bacterium]|nr:stage II sporulation protein M [Alphaproteobacteria bacterium]